MGNAFTSAFDSIGAGIADSFKIVGDAIASPFKYVLGDRNAFNEVADDGRQWWKDVSTDLTAPVPRAVGQGQNVSTTSYTATSNRNVGTAYSGYLTILKTFLI